MNNLESIPPMTWLIIGAAVIISISVLFNKAIKRILKLAVVLVTALFVIYFLIQAGVIPAPSF